MLSLFLGPIFSFFTGGFSKIFLFIKENPRPFIYITLAILIFFGGYFYSKDHWQSPLLEKISKYEKSEEIYKKQMKSISVQAEFDKENAKAEINAKNNLIEEISKKYKSEKEKKPRIFYQVKDPRNQEKTLNIEFNTSGQLICDRFSDEYKNALNSMIDEANKK